MCACACVRVCVAGCVRTVCPCGPCCVCALQPARLGVSVSVVPSVPGGVSPPFCSLRRLDRVGVAEQECLLCSWGLTVRLGSGQGSPGVQFFWCMCAESQDVFLPVFLCGGWCLCWRGGVPLGLVVCGGYVAVGVPVLVFCVVG